MSRGIKIHKCLDGCCELKIKYYPPLNVIIPNGYKKKKAGIFIYDPESKKVLLVQSRGQMWGIPKGTVEEDETWEQCAIREVKEETGVCITHQELKYYIKIYKKAVYYYTEKAECEVTVQENSVDDNDANAIGWIKVGCLHKMVENGNIVLNKHTKIVFYRFLKKTFPKNDYTVVKYKR